MLLTPGKNIVAHISDCKLGYLNSSCEYLGQVKKAQTDEQFQKNVFNSTHKKQRLKTCLFF